MAITCRYCGRLIAPSPATGLWWPIERPPPELDHKHEP